VAAAPVNGSKVPGARFGRANQNSSTTPTRLDARPTRLQTEIQKVRGRRRAEGSLKVRAFVGIEVYGAGLRRRRCLRLLSWPDTNGCGVGGADLGGFSFARIALSRSTRGANG
jgi:hypothetical protein